MAVGYERLDFGPGWKATNDNLIELVDLFSDHDLDWTPRDGEWSARVIFGHLIGARYHGPIAGAEDLAHLRDLPQNCETREGIKEALRRSWAMLARFLSDATKLDAVYDEGPPSGSKATAPPTMGSVERAESGLDLGYRDHPGAYTGHYIAYHRFAHDLHHRSTLVGYLTQLGVTLDGHRIRPL